MFEVLYRCCGIVLKLFAATFILVHYSHNRDEADEFVEIGALNGIFVLGRSMGFIGE